MAPHMYYVDLNEYFMLRMHSGLRLCGTLLTSGLGAGYHLWPHDSVCAKWTPPSSTLKPINGLGCGISADGKGQEAAWSSSFP